MALEPLSQKFSIKAIGTDIVVAKLPGGISFSCKVMFIEGADIPLKLKTNPVAPGQGFPSVFSVEELVWIKE
ncbi:hypothetical protein DO628_24055 [Salmonella enterica subsp. salamae]|nr:hypothetical protein [Salmonella enterica subsp. salamae serovar Sofia]EBS4544189.1 hypothetical protein [Salmonella enterica subsp. salamae serovar Sofia]